MQEFKHVGPNDPIGYGEHNRQLDTLNALTKTRGDAYIGVRRNAAGFQVYWCGGPIGIRSFLLTQDTPQNQGYVTGMILTGGGLDGSGNTQSWETESQPTDQKIYDPAFFITGGTYNGPPTPPGNDPPQANFPSYGSSGQRLVSNWTKRGFLCRADWSRAAGQWLIVSIEHIARFINFSYGGTGKTYSFGSPDTNLSVLQYWDGLNPAVTPFTPTGGSPGISDKTNQISLVNSPDGGFTIQSGAIGTAAWRDDLDNSKSWQYQIIDMACSTSGSTT
jgi:hypothetical protein